MKKLFLLVFTLFIYTIIFAGHLVIHKTDGTQVPLNLREIDNISFDTVSPPVQGEMVFVEGGSFSPNEGAYNVTLSSFYISKYEVTQTEWMNAMYGNPNNITIVSSSFPDKPTHPMQKISFFAALVFCNRLSIREGLTPVYAKDGDTDSNNWGRLPTGSGSSWESITMNINANGYRLPTEMEWEWAARGGIPAQQAGTFDTIYSGSNDIEDVAWYRDNASSILPGGSSHPDYGTHPVGSKAPNELGLYDMSGNVSEMCWDRGRWEDYPEGSFTNPTGQSEGTFRRKRGGSWISYDYECSVSYRQNTSQESGWANIGFRLVRSNFY